MELLKSGTLEVPETQDSALKAENVEDNFPGSEANNKVNKSSYYFQSFFCLWMGAAVLRK